MFDLDRHALHFRHRGVGAADRKQRHHGKIAGQRQQYAVVILHRRTQAIAMLSGMSPPSAQ